MNINFNSVLNTLASKAKALALNVTEIELKVLDATNEDPWGPHGKDMQEIARAAEEPEKYNLIMNVVSERLQMRDENWRLCYKALLLLEFLVKHGPWRVVEELNRSVSSLERLRDDFEYKDPQGRDQGINVRQRAGELAALVSNTERVRQEREKAARNANKYRGLSSADARGGGGGFGNGGFGSGGGGYTGYSGFGGGSSRGQQPYGGSHGGGGSYGSGGTESVHVPGGSFHSRNGSGGATTGGTSSSRRGEDAFRSAGGGVGGSGRVSAGPTGGSGAGADDTEDPFEATRKRIERLKAEGALPEPAPSAPPPGLADPPTSAKAPKKLSDIKINPAVAATFATIGIPASSSAGNLGKLAPPPAPSVPLSVAQHGGSSSLDVFGDSKPDTPSHQQQPQRQSVPAVEAAWDAAFGVAAPAASAAAVAAAADDPFAAFSNPAPVPAAPVAAAAPAPASTAGFDAFFGGATAVAPQAPAAAATRAALSLDDFSELSTEPSLAPQTSAVGGTGATPAADPFSAFASSSSVSRPATTTTSSAPSIQRPQPAASTDPFAALTASRSAAPAPKAPASSRPPGATPAAAFDAFGPSSTAAAQTPQSVSTGQQAALAAASDPFAALASSSSLAPPPPPVSAVSRPVHAQAAAPFDPFAPAPFTLAAAPKTTAASTAAIFDAFGTGPSAAARPPAEQAPNAAFGSFFGPATTSMSTAPTPATADLFADPFASKASFAAFPPPSTTAAAAAAHPASGGAVAMNKSGAAHGSAGHKSHDPFAGLGF